MKAKTSPVRWRKEWVSEDLSARNNLSHLKWVKEEKLKPKKIKRKETEKQDPEPEPTSEILYLCSYQGCGKTFLEEDTLKRHVQIHDGRQFVCYYDGCGKDFSNNFNLKRHILTHTGEMQFICPREGCGKAFSQDTTLRSHMQTHSSENHQICPFKGCGKRYIYKSTLDVHIKMHDEKQELVQNTERDKPQNVPKTPSAERPYACSYKGCEKNYIHEYKLNLHIAKDHSDSDVQMKRVKENELNHVPSSKVTNDENISFVSHMEVRNEINGKRVEENNIAVSGHDATSDEGTGDDENMDIVNDGDYS